MKGRCLALCIVLSIFGCATTTPSGSRPHDMSIAKHEAAAQREELVAAVWTSITNPTDASRQAADEHRREAAAHRASSAALRDAEARACVGISPQDRDTSPFEHSEDIESVAPLMVRLRGGRSPYDQIVGATVTFRAVPGMTAEWLQRVVDCHLARNASLGHVVPEMPNCPLVPNGATATVSSTGRGFAVAIRATDPSTAKEILARAQRLISPHATRESSQR